jgi:two-component system sensor histidine kinase YesM
MTGKIKGTGKITKNKGTKNKGKNKGTGTSSVISMCCRKSLADNVPVPLFFGVFKSDLDDIIILKKDGIVFESSGEPVMYGYDFFQADWFPKYHEIGNHIIFIAPHSQSYYYDNTKKDTMSISALYPIRDIFYNNRLLGIVIGNLNVKKISSIIQRLQKSNKERIYLMDNNQLIFTSEHEQSIEFNKFIFDKINKERNGFIIDRIDGKKSLLMYTTSQVNNWKIIMTVPIELLTEKVRKFRNLIMIILLITIPIIWVITYMISNKIMRPINLLMNRMAIVEIGDFKINSLDDNYQEDSYQEIKVLSSRFNVMIERIGQLIDKTYKIELEQKESQLRALQARINPHFLYNSLQTIKSMAMLGLTKDISNMVTSLGFLFRYAIEKEDYMVTVQDEMDHARHYLKIQLRWLHKQCSIEYNVDQSIMDSLLPRLTVQPIVENVFRHGFTQFKNDNIIKISGWQENGQVILEIWDNGVGMSPQRLQQVRDNLETLKDDIGKSIGLRNVHNRLVLKYGKEFGVRLNSVEGKWTKVTLIFPASSNKRGGDL